MAEIIQLSMSLLGAVAYALMTRVDVAVFVCAMQRVTHKPKIIHVERLNAVLRWVQANPKRLTFRPATGPSHLRCVGDVAFKKKKQVTPSEEPCSLSVPVTPIMVSRTPKLLIISVVNKLLLTIAVRPSSHNHV